MTVIAPTTLTWSPVTGFRSVLLTVFAIFGFSGHSWAFGSRHHGGGGNFQDSNQGGSTNPDNLRNGSDPFSNNNDHDNHGNNSNNANNDNAGNNTGNNPVIGVVDHSPIIGNNTSNNFPTAPVPEPLSLSLLGMGLTGILMKKRIK